MFTLYVDPEVERRKYPCVIVKAQVLFFEGRSPEVRLNDEVKISLVMKAPVADCTTFGSMEIEFNISVFALDGGPITPSHTGSPSRRLAANAPSTA